jgi:hypothetical protein
LAFHVQPHVAGEYLQKDLCNKKNGRPLHLTYADTQLWISGNSATVPPTDFEAYPHIVEMTVPLGGFGRKLDDMYEWHRARGIQDQRGRSWRDENGHDYIHCALLIPP